MIVRTRYASWLVLALVALTATGAVVVSESPARADAKKVQSIEGITEYQPRQRLAGAAVSRSVAADGDRQPDGARRLAARGLWRNRHGPLARAHGVQGHAHAPGHSQASAGARRQFNGTTWVDRTNYYETLPASDDNLDFALDLEADRLVNSFISQDDLISEMTVVRNEFERGENSPANLLNQRIMAAAFDWHNYGKSTIGNRTDIERVPIKNLQAFYQQVLPARQLRAGGGGQVRRGQGDGAGREVLRQAAQAHAQLDKTYTEEPPQDGERSVTLRRVGEVGLVAPMLSRSVGGHPDNAVLDVLGELPGVGPVGPAVQGAGRNEDGHRACQAGNVSWHDPGVFEVQAEVPQGRLARRGARQDARR